MRKPLNGKPLKPSEKMSVRTVPCGCIPTQLSIKITAMMTKGIEYAFMGSNDPYTKATTEATGTAELAGEIKEYLIAARRKVQIAEYHLGCLRSALAASEQPTSLQCRFRPHFEASSIP
jgi:hypothetical protein